MKIICIDKSENIKNLTVGNEYNIPEETIPENWVHVVNDSGNIARYASKFFKEEEVYPESLEALLNLIDFNYNNDDEFYYDYDSIDLTIHYKETSLALRLPATNGSDISCGIFQLYNCDNSYHFIKSIISLHGGEILKVLNHLGGNSIELFAIEIIRRAIVRLIENKPGAFLIANLIPSANTKLISLFEELADTTSEWCQNSNDTDYNDNKIFIFNLETTEEDIEDDDEW